MNDTVSYIWKRINELEEKRMGEGVTHAEIKLINNNISDLKTVYEGILEYLQEPDYCEV